MLHWVSSLFTCNHANTPVYEGKCYCPDCGSGLIYQWIILRCQECHARRETRYRFRQVIPTQRCCPLCGEEKTYKEALENPAYFQLRQARLTVVWEEPKHSQTWVWLRYLFGNSLCDYWVETLQQSHAWIEHYFQTPPRSKPVFTFILAYSNPNVI